jgi:hypothetical protein
MIYVAAALTAYGVPFGCSEAIEAQMLSLVQMLNRITTIEF